MLDVTRYTCPICQQAFTAEDDVVICPECGAPHHRECYRRSGKCAYAADHGTPAQWKPLPSKDSEEAIVCGNCGTVNELTDKFCRKCGHDLHEELPLPPSEQQPPVDESVFYAQFSPYIGLASDSTMDGLPVMDIATFVGQNAGFYLSRFHFMRLQNTKSSWNWSAAICPFLWAMYRKMFRLAAVIFLVEFLLFLPYFGVILLMLEHLGEEPGAIQQLLRGILPEVTLPTWLLIASNLAAAGGFLLRTFMAFSANHLYHKHVVKTIHAMQQPDGESVHYRYALAHKGGVSLVWPVTIALGVVLLVSCAAAFLAVIW